MMAVYFGSPIEKVMKFKFNGKPYYGELHCFCGWLVSDKNRMGVFVDHPAYFYFINKILPKNKNQLSQKVNK